VSERRGRWSWVIVVVVGLAVYLPWLGSLSLDSSEGLRAVPAAEMLARGDWLHQTIFEQTYVRKPPGIAWAIAASTGTLGWSEWTVRLPSALAGMAMGLVAWAFASRWFGGRWGVAAGLAQVLLPLFWSPGRTAEIEMLLLLFTQVGALALADLALGQKPGRAGTLAMGVLAGVGIAGSAIMKGPAAATVFAGVLVGACALRGIGPTARRVGVWGGIALGGIVAAAVLAAFARANARPEAIAEDVGGFLWSGERLVGTLTLIPAAFIAALPASLALVVPWGPDARREGGAGEQEDRARRVALGLAIAWFASVGVLMIVGVGNARYAMPAAVLLAPVVAYAARGVWGGGFLPHRVRIVRAMFLGRAWAWAIVLTLGALAAAGIAAERQRASPEFTGRTAGRALAAAVPAGKLWGDDLVEARADVLLYAKRASPGLEPRWAKAMVLAGELPPAGDYLALRTDGESGEAERYAGKLSRLERVHEGRVERYTFVVYRVRAE
jgi:4-amino-4-deoxy-L-arabinose transferase-like glycosyltransferase